MSNGPTDILSDCAKPDGDKRLERLFDYTKWHIGIYLTLGSGVVGLLASSSKLRSLQQTVQVQRCAPDAQEPTEQGQTMLLKLDELLRNDPVGAREQIRKFIPGGRIAMTPNPDGTWTANLRLYPPVLVGVPPHKRQRPRREVRGRILLGLRGGDMLAGACCFRGVPRCPRHLSSPLLGLLSCAAARRGVAESCGARLEKTK